MRFLVLFFSSFVALALCRISQLSDVGKEFEEWKRANGVKYESEIEHLNRLKIFTENKLVAAEHNRKYEKGESSFTMGMTKFADLTNEEYRAQMLTSTLKHKPATPDMKTANYSEGSFASTPSSIDWRQYGAVTGIKNQGQCGSCWSFAATGALEGQYFLKTGKQLSFSEQQQVSCNTKCYGCQGGWASTAFQFWMHTQGATLESSYPYTSGQYGSTGTCYSSTPVVWVSNYVETPSGDEGSLKRAVGSVGPVAVGIDASKHSFQLYNGGLYYEPSCSTTNLDHAVLAVGYGTTSSGWGYWIVKNTWGVNWGDYGYIYMIRDYYNNCGIATQCSYPTL